MSFLVRLLLEYAGYRTTPLGIDGKVFMHTKVGLTILDKGFDGIRLKNLRSKSVIAGSAGSLLQLLNVLSSRHRSFWIRLKRQMPQLRITRLLAGPMRFITGPSIIFRFNRLIR